MVRESGSSRSCYSQVHKAETSAGIELAFCLFSPMLVHRIVPHTVKVGCFTPINLIQIIPHGHD